jgi:membrane protein YqaA with SNARE-associated domain
MALSTRKKTLIIAALLALKVALWSWLLATVGAERVVGFVGVENAYLIMFLVAFLGGLSTFTSVTYVATVITLASGGVHPVGLAIASSAGVSLGDAIFYYIGFWGLRHVVAGWIGRAIHRASLWLEHKPRAFIFGAVYLYAGFTPLPNDVLAVALGALRQPLWLVLPALVLGNFTLTLLLAQFGSVLPL